MNVEKLFRISVNNLGSVNINDSRIFQGCIPTRNMPFNQAARLAQLAERVTFVSIPHLFNFLSIR